MVALTEIQIAALIVVTIGAVHDMLTSRIPNWLTFGAALLAVGMLFTGQGPSGALWGVTGWLLGLALSVALKLPPILLKWYKAADLPIGFGDTKLLAAVSAFLGPALVPVVFFYFCLWYGLLAIVQFARAIPFKELAVAIVLGGSVSALSGTTLEKLKAAGKTSIPLGPAIAGGTLCAIVFERQTLRLFGLG